MRTTILRRPQVLERTGLSTATIYRMIGRGEFPAPLRLSPGAVGWLESAVDEWIAARPRAAA